jgi:hypothetical protein
MRQLLRKCRIRTDLISSRSRQLHDLSRISRSFSSGRPKAGPGGSSRLRIRATGGRNVCGSRIAALPGRRQMNCHERPSSIQLWAMLPAMPTRRARPRQGARWRTTRPMAGTRCSSARRGSKTASSKTPRRCWRAASIVESSDRAATLRSSCAMVSLKGSTPSSARLRGEPMPSGWLPPTPMPRQSPGRRPHCAHHACQRPAESVHA